MSRRTPANGIALAVATSSTLFVTLHAWRGFTQSADGWLLGYLLAALAITLLALVLRRAGLPLALVVLAQLGACSAYLSMAVTGSPLPVGESWGELRGEVTRGMASVQEYAAPVPMGADSIVPVLLAAALVLLVVVDLLAAGLQRVSLAGLPLLAAYTVPVGLLGGRVPWSVFVGGAIGFLAMLYAQEHERLERWGKALATDADRARPLGSATYRLTALTTAVVASLAGAAVGAGVPTFDPNLFLGGHGPGGGNVTVDNPMVDLKRDLIRGPDVPLVTLTTDDPDPRYLRLATLTRFTDNTWSPGNRSIPEENRSSDATMPPPVGVTGTPSGPTYTYRFDASGFFRSTWLPTFQYLTHVDAPGDWTYDADTRDFITPSGEADALSGLSWSETVQRLRHSPAALEQAPSASGQVSKKYTDLPDGYPREATTLAREVTAGARSPYEQAVLLQRWFQEDGGFVYNQDVAPGTGSDDLMAFLTEGNDGRQGYCEQFSAAMAAMGRSLGIPSRVAVGFLRPERRGDGSYVYSAHDLHAWPEMFFPGSGWVEFEPTPVSHTRQLPAWSDHAFPALPDPTTLSPSTGASPSAVEPTARPRTAPDPAAGATDGGAEPFPWRWLLTTLGVLALVVLGSCGPRTVRRLRRRARTRRAGPEDAWAELHDVAVDLGLPWPADDSPRATTRLLAGRMGAPGNTDERPRTGEDQDPLAVDALLRVALAVERARYARPGAPAPGGLWHDVETCVEGWTAGVTPAARRRALWWPRSVLVRRRPRPPVPAVRVERDSEGRLEHVR